MEMKTSFLEVDYLTLYTCLKLEILVRVWYLTSVFWNWECLPHNRYLDCCYCSVTQSCLTLCNPMDCSTPGFPVLHCLPELAQTHVHWVSDAIQPSYPLSSPSPPAFHLSQQRGLFQWVSSSHQYWSIGVSVSTSVLPLNIQDWCPLGWTGWISLQSNL